jgi:hypothetical protein
MSTIQPPSTRQQSQNSHGNNDFDSPWLNVFLVKARKAGELRLVRHNCKNEKEWEQLELSGGEKNEQSTQHAVKVKQ